MAKKKKVIIREIPSKIREIEKDEHSETSELEEDVAEKEVQDFVDVVSGRSAGFGSGLVESETSEGASTPTEHTTTARQIDQNTVSYAPSRSNERKYESSIQTGGVPVHLRRGIEGGAERFNRSIRQGGEGQELRRPEIEDDDTRKYEMEKSKRRTWAGE